MSQPNSISVYDIAFAIVSDVLNSPVAKQFFDFPTINIFRFSRKTHYSAQFVEGRFRAMRKGGQNITQVDCVVGVPFEVGSRRKTDCRHFVDHCAVS